MQKQFFKISNIQNKWLYLYLKHIYNYFDSESLPTFLLPNCKKKKKIDSLSYE